MSVSRTPRGKDRGLALEDERVFLLRSIADLESERGAGALDEEDFAGLSARYEARLADVAEALAALGDEARTPAPPAGATVPKRSRGTRVSALFGRRRVRVVTGVVAAACFALAATLAAASMAGVRLPGESATGSVNLPSAEQEQETLDRAAILGSEGQAAEAVRLYDEVLAGDPDQPQALTYGGWLERVAGLQAGNRTVVERGDASVAKAVRVAPSYPDAHALYGVILYEDYGRAGAAARQFAAAVAAHGSRSLLASVAPVAVKAFSAAGRSLPAQYAG